MRYDMIDVIIPAYNAHETILKTLSSITMQSCVDLLNVYIVNDGSDYDYSEIVNKFNKYLRLKELKLVQNRGVGYARNYGMKHSKGKYITFIDSDDVYFSHYTLDLLYKNIERGQYNCVISNFLEEVQEGKFLLHESEQVWNHGKIYRRQFIEKNRIRFSETRTNEDLYFNLAIILLDERIKYINDITYLWLKNDNSITRTNNHEYNFTALSDYNKNIQEVFKWGMSKKVPLENIVWILFYGLIEMYYLYIPIANKPDSKLKQEIFKNVKENALLFKSNAKYLKLSDKNKILKKQIKKLMLNDSFSYYILTNETFDKFIDEVINYEG